MGKSLPNKKTKNDLDEIEEKQAALQKKLV